MMLNEITEQAGGHKRRKRVGRGESSGSGKTSGKGHKGCQSRSGGGTRLLSEGGQMPIFRRLPKRGFSNYNFRIVIDTVNVCDLERRFADGDTVDLGVMKKMRLISGAAPVKILAKGALSKKLTVEANLFSGKAKQVIEAAGGATKVIELRDRAVLARDKRNSAKSRPTESRTNRLAKKKQAAAQD